MTPPKSMIAYMTEVELAARTILEGIETALKKLQDEELDYSFQKRSSMPPCRF
jgi:hypothetical protein